MLILETSGTLPLEYLAELPSLRFQEDTVPRPMAGSPFQLLRPQPFGHDWAMDTSQTRSQRIYDHRLRDLVQAVGNADVVAAFSVPRSTVQGWLRGEYQPVVTVDFAHGRHAPPGRGPEASAPGQDAWYEHSVARRSVASGRCPP